MKENKRSSNIHRLFIIAMAVLALFVCGAVGCGDGNAAEGYTVTFMTDGGSAVPDQVVEPGGKVIKPEDPVKAGASFLGWYKDAGFSAPWSFTADVVTSDTTLYARWSTSQTGGNGNGTTGEERPIVTGDHYTVTFNVGLDARKAGLSNPAAADVKPGEKVREPEVSLAGSKLDGWYAENGERKWDFASDKVEGNVTLFARWRSGGEDMAYTPTLNASGTLYIHYLRRKGDYDKWQMYTWRTGSDGAFYQVAATDASGAIFALPLSDYSLPAADGTQVNFIITLPDWKKDGGDNVVKLGSCMKAGGSYHWFVREGATNSGTAYAVGFGTGEGAQHTTEEKRASRSDVDRSIAAALPVMETAATCEELGVGYQIFVASFCDSDGDGTGDLRGIIKRLDYLKSLNVDVLWLTPIQRSNSVHGYDCYDYYSIDPRFGTDADYRELVYKAHQNGIKVIMDLVVNHTSPQNEWFIKSKDAVVETVTHQDGTTEQVHYRDFYRWTNKSGNRKHGSGDGWYYYSSFGGSMPELNYDCQAVRNAMTDVASYWMSYGLDGFRMDAIKHVFMWDESVNEPDDVEGGVGDNGYNYNLTKNVEFFKEFNKRLKTRYPHCFLLGEQLSGNVDDVSPFYRGMDSLFDFNTYYDLPGRIKSGDAEAAAEAFNSNAAKYLENRGDRPINSMISSNHDIPRLSAKLDGDAERLYLAVTLTLPGLTWIYYGDELGMKNSGGGDNAYRQSMRWTDGWEDKCTVIGYGGANDKLASVQAQSNDETSLLSYVRSLCKLRHDHPALINGVAVCSEENGLLRISVTSASEKLTVYHNFSSAAKTVSGTPVFGSGTIPQYGTCVIKG